MLFDELDRVGNRLLLVVDHVSLVSSIDLIDHGFEFRLNLLLALQRILQLFVLKDQKACEKAAKSRAADQNDVPPLI